MDFEPAVERRREPRFPFPSIIRYIADHENCDDLQKGVTINISDNGACLYIYKDFSGGGILRFKDKLPVATDEAAIVWVRQIDASLYQTGVSFLK